MRILHENKKEKKWARARLRTEGVFPIQYINKNEIGK